MTDEEKAEEYLEKHKEITHIKGIYHLTINEKQAYLDGLAEGRKEKEKLIGTFINVDLEKENEELKAQIEQLSNDNNVLKTSFLIQREQIEKMKNCWNCKFFKEKKYQACKDYKKNKTKCCSFYKWEKAE